jgi:hypothetical protein
MFQLSRDLLRRLAGLSARGARSAAARRRRWNARWGFGDFDSPVHDDLAAIRCLRETYPDRLPESDCAGFYRADGRLIWEDRGDDAD